ncbi:hypothetical protein [Myxosarcina sp. GI1]|uniref:type IV pilus modification PilV family protein n=1 Tax=Myxosarcina sp. GI1 TaxID=1541065 RepID=UPI000568F7A4|nr:hypothetical protein [Myxosarcina sp. GI1]
MLQYLIKCKSKKLDRDRGFTTLEVIISLLIALAFVAVSMQSLVYAMAMKVQAQEKQRANQLIQEDIERINQLGSSNGLTGNCTPANYAGGYADGLWNILQTLDNSTEPDGLGKFFADNATTKVTKTIRSDGTGKELGLRRFHVSNSGSVFPHRTLKIRYQVWEWDGTNFVDSIGSTDLTGDNPIADTYVEVIPDVALACS